MGGEALEGLVDVPHLISIRASNIFRLLVSLGLCSSSTFNRRSVRRGTTFSLASSTHCAISFPAPVTGPSTRPRTLRPNGTRLPYFSVRAPLVPDILEKSKDVALFTSQGSMGIASMQTEEVFSSEIIDTSTALHAIIPKNYRYDSFMYLAYGFLFNTYIKFSLINLRTILL